MPLSDRGKTPRMLELHGDPDVLFSTPGYQAHDADADNMPAPHLAFNGDPGVCSRDITEAVATEFASGATHSAVVLATNLDLSREAVTKRIERFRNLGLIHHTRFGWQATIRGQEVLKKVVAEG
jgi:hypothetical protein